MKKITHLLPQLNNFFKSNKIIFLSRLKIEAQQRAWTRCAVLQVDGQTVTQQGAESLAMGSRERVRGPGPHPGPWGRRGARHHHRAQGATKLRALRDSAVYCQLDQGNNSSIGLIPVSN